MCKEILASSTNSEFMRSTIFIDDSKNFLQTNNASNLNIKNNGIIKSGETAEQDGEEVYNFSFKLKNIFF